MKKCFLRVILFSFLILPLAACFGPKTPQDVASTFWKAVLENDVKDAVAYSTLSDPQHYDGFSMEWAGYQSSFGKVIIEDKEASIDTEMIGPANTGQESKSFITYLVIRNNEWKVDYDRTKHSIHGGPLGELFSRLDQVGDDLSKQLESSADALKLEMERLGKEFEKLSKTFGQQASESLEKYAEQLRDSLKELEESINRALEEESNNLSADDKRVLREIAADLDQDSEDLSNPSVEVVTEGGKKLSEKQQRLEGIDNDSLDDYKKEWREVSRQLEAVIHQMMNELSAMDEKDKAAKKSF